MCSLSTLARRPFRRSFNHGASSRSTEVGSLSFLVRRARLVVGLVSCQLSLHSRFPAFQSGVVAFCRPAFPLNSRDLLDFQCTSAVFCRQRPRQLDPCPGVRAPTAVARGPSLHRAKPSRRLHGRTDFRFLLSRRSRSETAPRSSQTSCSTRIRAGMPNSRRRMKPRLCPMPSFEDFPHLRSAFDDFEGERSSSTQPKSAPPSSKPSSSPDTVMTTLPTLTDILLGVSPPPWTLSAFIAFLSQNHCLETLEFTMDTQRYASTYAEMSSQEGRNNECTSAMWERLMQSYIIPCAVREVNIPAHVRDRLLGISSRPHPPPPSELDEAGRIIFELMNDSVLLPFLESFCPAPTEPFGQHQIPSSTDSFSISRSRHTMPALSTSASLQADLEGLTDDSDTNSPPPTTEPMTPPATPSTTNDWGFANSSGTIRNAVAAHNMGWKKMGAKLGFGRKSSSRRSTPTSSGSAQANRSSL